MSLQGPGAIVVDVIRQPPVTRELGMGDVVLGAVGLTGAIMIGALVTGGYLVLYLCDTQRYAGKRYVGRCHDELLLSCGRLLQFLGVVATLREKDSSRVMPLLVYRKIL